MSALGRLIDRTPFETIARIIVGVYVALIAVIVVGGSYLIGFWPCAACR